MPAEIIECVQGTPEWFRARMGIPTASEFATVMAKGKTPGSPSLTRATYMRKLAGEIVCGEPQESFTNAAMERGKAMEEEARTYYALMKDETPELVGFVRNGRAGATPDSFITDRGGLEIKTAAPHVLIEKIMADKFPPEHMAQVQGNLMVCERDWWDLLIYWPKMPTFIKRIWRDENYIGLLRTEVNRFNDELDQMVDTVKRYGVAA